MKKIIVLMVMMVMLCGCQERPGSRNENPDLNVIRELIEEKEETQETVEEPEKEAEEEISESTIRPEVKEAIDAYEDFVDEYIAFMEKYEEADGSDLSLLVDYMSFMGSIIEYTDKMEDLEDDLTTAESIYYYEVLNRCNEKMIRYLD